MDEEGGACVRRIAEVPHDGLAVVHLHEPTETECRPCGALRYRPGGGEGLLPEKRPRVERHREPRQVTGGGYQAVCSVKRRGRILRQGRAAPPIHAIGT